MILLNRLSSLYFVQIALFFVINIACADKIPIIDISGFYNGSSQIRKQIANKIGNACRDVGFFVISGYQFDDYSIIDAAWNSTRLFFDQDGSYKNSFMSANETKYPFGYVPLGGEVLELGKSAEKKSITSRTSNSQINKQQEDEIAFEKTHYAPAVATTAIYYPDLKEMFSLGPSNPLAGFHPRIYPNQPQDFESSYSRYYEELTNLSLLILQAFAIALELPSEHYFEQFLDHHASCIRALNYPPLPTSFIPGPTQLRTSAHTDYGAITILRTDGPGLQVAKDKGYSGNNEDHIQWIDVPYIKDGFIVNLGDLMKRWTNDLWLSTLHRVIITNTNITATSYDSTQSTSQSSTIQGTEELNESQMGTCTDEGTCDIVDQQDYVPSSTLPVTAHNDNDGIATARRQSIAFFCNLNPDAIVTVLPSPVIQSTTGDAKYSAITAGQFLLLKHLAAAHKPSSSPLTSASSATTLTTTIAVGVVEGKNNSIRLKSSKKPVI